jgi:hypothetical protein
MPGGKNSCFSRKASELALDSRKHNGKTMARTSQAKIFHPQSVLAFGVAFRL